MTNMFSSKHSRISKLIIILITVFIILLITSIVLIRKFPIESKSKQIQRSLFSNFFSVWPISPLDQELQERKKIRRYSKTEQSRRIQRELEKMQYLSTPIYDFFLSNETEIYSNNYYNYSNEVDFQWPILNSNIYYTNQQNKSIKRNMSYILQPQESWTKISEGIYFSSGDELRSVIPLTTNKRFLNFTVLPIAPGNIRVLLGQYVWARTFSIEDVHKTIRLSIPVNDSNATAVRIISISFSGYLVEVTLNQITKNARIPIKVSKNSNMWSANKDLLITENIEKLDSDPINESSDNSDSTNESDEDNSINEDNQTSLPDKKLIQQPPQAINTPTEAQIQDPLLQIANQQMNSSEPFSTALGYNILFLQFPEINSDYMHNTALVKKMTPTLYSFLKNSYLFENIQKNNMKNNEFFRSVSYLKYKEIYNNNIPILQDLLQNRSENSLYFNLRKFGYKVVSIADPSAFFFKKNISENKFFMSLYNRWLSYNDWTFEKKNFLLDNRNGSYTGLNAIFKTEEKTIPRYLSASDYLSLAEYFSNVAKNEDKFPEWRPNEYLLMQNDENYIQSVIESFQSWAGNNQQSRFFAHVSLDGEDVKIRPTLGDLKRAFSSTGFSKIFSWSDYARLSYLDRTLRYISEILTSKKIENRTLVFIYIPQKSNDMALFKIPGLIAKNPLVKTIDMKSILSTLLSSVGIHIDPQNEKSLALNKESLESNHLLSSYSIQNKTNINSNKYAKYSLYLENGNKHCKSFIWQSNGSNIFGIQASAPIVQKIQGDLLEFHPCSVDESYVYITWYQDIKNENIQTPQTIHAEEIKNVLGGNFLYQKSMVKEIPSFYFGSSLISANNLIFLSDRINNRSLANLFVLKESDPECFWKLVQEAFSVRDPLNEFSAHDPLNEGGTEKKYKNSRAVFGMNLIQ